MKAYLIRTYQEKETLGTLIIIDPSKVLDSPFVYNCYTIELPNKENKSKISSILEGTYTVKKIVSPTKGRCFLLMDVPGRTAVEMHIGNYAAGKKVDTEGCILPGAYFTDLNKDGNLDVAGSTDTMTALLNILPDEFTLKILS